MQIDGAGRAWPPLLLLGALLQFVAVAAEPQSVSKLPRAQVSALADSSDLDSELQRGRLHARVGDFMGAEKIFATVIAQHPESADAHYNLGLAILGISGNKGGANDALQELNLALGIRHEFPEAENVLGMLLFDKGDPDAALVHLRRAVSEDPASAEIHFHLGRVLSRSDDKAAEAKYRQANSLRPHYPEAQVALGDLLLRTGRVAEAKSSFEAALRDNPDLEGAHYGMARVLKSTDDQTAAVFEFDEAKALIQRKSDAVMATRLSNAALDLAKEGRKNDAVAEAKKAVLLAPDNGVAVFNLGLLLADAGDLPAALHEVRKAAFFLPMNSGVESTLLKLEQAVQPNGLGGPDATERDASIQLKRRSPPGGLQQADAPRDSLAFARELVRAKDFLGAAGVLLQGLREQPASRPLRLELTSVWLQMERWQEAELEARKIILIEPFDWQAHFDLSQTLLHKGDQAGAEAQLRVVLRLDPENPLASKMLRPNSGALRTTP